MISTPATSLTMGKFDSTLTRITELLLAEINSEGYWTGELSSSALSTAVATIALGKMDRANHAGIVESGLRWLSANANTDGGWGDTIRSKSNISTTALCWAAFGAANADQRFPETVRFAETWLVRAAGSLENLPHAISLRYGKDRTFSVPILMTLALSGRLGANGWKIVPGLPFELAMVPQKLYGAMKLPVVSYALPALIAIGQAIHHHHPSRNPLVRGIRNASRSRTLRLLSDLQPANGGFLEATPLTAFVTMSLASAGHAPCSVAQKAAAFLRESRRGDGSWPIDTNLATWVTTLSVKALAHQPEAVIDSQKGRIREWLLAQQTSVTHPYTGAAAGAWAWTDLPGGVPDADDTAGALIALSTLGKFDHLTINAAERGVRWLLDLQNRDGGIPTFCSGWGALPFDRSTPEITAHTLRAWTLWRPHLKTVSSRIERPVRRAMRYLERHQNADGSFIPLWFGNEHATDENNPVYGTAQVLTALNEMAESGETIPAAMRSNAARYLVRTQSASGGWGGDQSAPESIEETSVAIEALNGCEGCTEVVDAGVRRLCELLVSEQWQNAAPVGLYFARLWYYERLYPLIFAASALGSVKAQSNRPAFAAGAGAS